MIATAPPGPPGIAAPRAVPSVAALRQRLAEVVPGPDADSPRLRAAVILLLAGDAGTNIDRLARLTGYQRHFVAACARRLYDNGVWASGGARYAWATAEDPAFWSDVEVALGALQRRPDAPGQPAWASPGDSETLSPLRTEPPGAEVWPQALGAPTAPSAGPDLFPGASWLG